MSGVAEYSVVVLAAFGLMQIFGAIRKRVTWAGACRFAWKRAMGRAGGAPVGLPGNRDPESQCRYYWPVDKPSGSGSCMTDGHYLCRECDHISREALIERALIERVVIEDPEF